MNRRDRRLPQRVEEPPHVSSPAHLAGHDRRGSRSELANVPAGAKRGTGAAEHERTEGLVVSNGRERGVKVVAHLGVVGVPNVGAVERDPRHPPAAFEEDRAKRARHASPLLQTTRPSITVARTRMAAISAGGTSTGSRSTTTRSASLPGASVPHTDSSPPTHPPPSVFSASASSAKVRCDGPSRHPAALSRNRA